MSEKYKYKDLKTYIHKIESALRDYHKAIAIQESKEECNLLLETLWEESVEGDDEKPDKIEKKEEKAESFNKSGWNCVYYAYRPNLPNRIVAVLKLENTEMFDYVVVDVDTFNHKHYFTTGWRYKIKDDALQKLREKCQSFYTKFLKTEEELKNTALTLTITDKEFKDIFKGELIKIEERK